MISKILIAVAAVVILVGLLGLKKKTVGGRLMFVGIAAVGTVLLAVGEMNTYGLVGGSLQLLYRLVAILPCILVWHSICKKNRITDIDKLAGVGRKMPYTYLLLVILSVVLIGVPITGTFTGLIYSEIGLLAGGYGVFTYIGFLGNVLGVVVPAVLIYPMLRRMYFPSDEELDRAEDTEQPKEQTQPAKGLLVIGWLLAFLLIGLSLYQQPVLAATSTVIQKLFG